MGVNRRSRLSKSPFDTIPPILKLIRFKMKRIFLLAGLFLAATLLTSIQHDAAATSAFNKQWKKEYLPDGVDKDFKKTARKAGCYVCHVKGEDKKEVRNEYGEAVHKYLDAEDFEKDYVKANPEEAAERIVEGLKKAGEEKSSDGKKFAEKIEALELPATDAGLE